MCTKPNKTMNEIDWSSLSFGYMKTDYNVRCYYRNGAWGEIENCSEETIPMHMAPPVCTMARRLSRA